MKVIRLKKKSNSILNVLIFFYFFSMILEKVKWNILGWSCDIFTLATVMFFPFLILYITFIQSSKIMINKFEKKVIFYYVFFFSYLCIQFLVLDQTSNVKTQYSKGLITFIITIIATLNIIMVCNMKKGLDLNRFSKYFYYITMINVFYCVVQNFNPKIDEILVNFLKSDVSRYGVDSYGALGRVTGLLLESNFNGPFLVIGIINIFELLINSSKSKKEKIIYLFSLVIAIIELLLTFSRTAYLGFAVCILYYFVKFKFTYKLRVMLGLLILSIAFMYVYITNYEFRIIIQTRFSFLNGSSSLKSDSHYKIFIQALSIYVMNIRNIIFGVGYNCLNIYYVQIFHYTMMKAHNFFLQMLCEVGIIGLSFNLYYLYLLRSVSKRNRFLNAVLISTIAMNFTYDPLSRNYNLLILAASLLIYRKNIKSRF